MPFRISERAALGETLPSAGRLMYGAIMTPKPPRSGRSGPPSARVGSGRNFGPKTGPKSGPKSGLKPAASPGGKPGFKSGQKPGHTGAKAGARPAFKPGAKAGPKTAPRPGVQPASQPGSDAPAVPERIAKVLARAGIASRRDAEKMIEDGRVTVNGIKIERAALNVLPSDDITVDGKPVADPEDARLWLYYKPVGLVTTTRDEQGRETIFDRLPEDLPRVVTVGRLDLNSEGLLLLTNDGGIKRRLELPSTGWLRRYRVRVNGRPTDDTFAPLRAGITVDGQSFQPMQVVIDRQQGANAWLTVGLREGKNREIRRAMTDIGLTVNRLIRVSYGPFQLGQLKAGEVQEIRGKVLRDQLGLEGARPDRPTPTRRRKPPAKAP
ncbi:RNA pseudouridylate synthase family protein, putative [Citreicella sp. 357]|nr:RNA pseudouridylate synthase family protein, putative [Citreicella sp. 357]